MRFLLALDSSTAAMEEAVRLASERKASLTALFVFDSTWPEFIGHDWLSGSNAREGFLDYVSADEKDLADKTIEEFRKRAAGIEFEVKLAAGRVPEEILKELQFGYDLVIMAVPFKRGLEALRSPLSKIISDPPCSIYLVR